MRRGCALARDCARAARYNAALPTALRPALRAHWRQGIVVYDINSRKSFEAMEYWLKEAAEHGAKDTAYVVVGNKTDSGHRVVKEEEGRAFAKKHGMPYFETTAKDGDNVQEMFHELFAMVVERLKL